MATLPPIPTCPIWQVLSGLVTLHLELPSLPSALPLALGMGEFVWRRGEALRAAKGAAHWAEMLDYEVAAARD